MSSITSVLNVSVTGTGAHTVLLANGIGTTQYTWRHVVKALAPHYRVVRFDHAGTPGADVAHYDGERYTTLHGYADDAVALLDELGVEGATWVGHSVGGMIGLLAAATAPDRVGRLVLLGASPRYVDDAAAGYRGGFARSDVDALLAAVADDYHAWAAGFSALAVGLVEGYDRADAVAEFAESLRRMRPDIAHRTLTTILTGDYRAALPRVDQPVTIIQPCEDVAVPTAVGRFLAARLPNAVYRELATVGHVPQLTDAAAVLPVLNEALGGALDGALSNTPARAMPLTVGAIA